MSTPTTRDLAEIAYAAYGVSTGGKNYQGLPMPRWDELPALTQLAWIEATGAVTMRTLEMMTGVRRTIAPTIGDVVLVPADPSTNNGAQVAPAIVTRVWSDTTVNVRVLHDSHSLDWRTSLVYRDSLEGASPLTAAWTWPGDDA